MTQTTEAACLLQTGAMYSRRIGFRSFDGGIIFAGVKPGAVSIYFGDAPIYHFDLDGRWQRAFIEGVHFLKGLDASVRSIDREREAGTMVLRRRILPFGEAVDLDASIRSMALELIDTLDGGSLDILETPANSRFFAPDEFREFLERVAAWDATAWFAHRERFLGTYGPISFLPPDSSNALILQATIGNANGVAFGQARTAEHYVRSPKEFEDHARAVSKLMGRRISQCRGIFLGGADSLRQPLGELLQIFQIVRRVFPLAPAGFTEATDSWDESPSNPVLIHAFLDDFRDPLPDVAGLRALQELGLGRVTLGIESGSATIRTGFGRSWVDSDLRSFVSNLKAAGIGIGVVVLVGSGGRARAEEHRETTVRLLRSIDLDRSNLVTLVDSRSLAESRVEDALSDEEVAAEVASLKARCAEDRGSKGPKVVAYNPDKQFT